MTTWWFVLDGAGHEIVQSLRARSGLPHLDAVARRGVSCSLAPSSPSCQTPPGLATLFTGSPRMYTA